MTLLRNALITVLLATLPLAGWAAVGLSSAMWGMVGAGCVGCDAVMRGPAMSESACDGVQVIGLQQAPTPTVGTMAAQARMPTRHGGMGCPAGDPTACHASCGATLATASPAVSPFPLNAAPVPQPDGQRIPSAARDAPYRPPRA